MGASVEPSPPVVSFEPSPAPSVEPSPAGTVEPSSEPTPTVTVTAPAEPSPATVCGTVESPCVVTLGPDDGLAFGVVAVFAVFYLAAAFASRLIP